jgi:hypothetical protein
MAQDDDFPYKRLGSNMESEIRVRFIALCSYRARWISRPYQINNAREMKTAELRFRMPVSTSRDDRAILSQWLFVQHPRDYEQYNLISDYFIEEIRVRAFRPDDEEHKSAYTYWCEHRDAIRKQCARSSDEMAMNFCAREIIYNNVHEVGTFRPTVACDVIQLLRKKFNNTCDWILNPCAGWGDRLIAAMASGVKGMFDVDPNEALGARYEEIARWGAQIFATRPPIERIYVAQPFEDVADDLFPRLYDLALIAPPYFDLEIYVTQDDARAQSVTRYPTFDSWYANFLIPLVLKSARHLRIGGIAALVINQYGTTKFLRRMIADISRDPGLRYLGVVSYAEINDGGHVRSPQPIWFWTRIANSES